MNRRNLLRTAVLAGVAGAAIPERAWAKPTPPPGPRDISYHQWSSDPDFAAGSAAGVTVGGGALTFASAVGQSSYTDVVLGTTGTYDYATWTSPMTAVGFTATQAIPSWTASTPGGSFVRIELRGVTVAGATTGWYQLGVWAADDSSISRTSVAGQSDVNGSIATDTFVAASGNGLTQVQLRVTLLRPVGSGLAPRVNSIGVVASSLPGSATITGPLMAQGITLAVPQYSQDIHAGQYPQWSGGGEAWCSPTSTSMVVAYWGSGPAPSDYAWVNSGYADPWIDYAARNTYDYTYHGAGNWPFNTAYAGRFGLDAFVTRLRSLNEAESFIAAGIPLVLSLSFTKKQIPGLSYSTGGHLLVLAGFSSTGQPVLNDPASPSDAAVRKTVGRSEFESAWLTSSGGTVYVITPAGYPLPARTPQANW